ncbi:hypothetical protein TIFTF001_001764 [Ficus carica]|uniref:Uncharacterized protein n=1 Tax=Ficus carica TaxID=3494 RepID=A0AA87Z0S7_FICCA|nr:hypothetical protein TIFTF001_001764 [Ficus carica]
MASPSPKKMRSSPLKLTLKLGAGDCDTVAWKISRLASVSGENTSAWEIFLSSRSPLAKEICLQSPGEKAPPVDKKIENLQSRRSAASLEHSSSPEKNSDSGGSKRKEGLGYRGRFGI